MYSEGGHFKNKVNAYCIKKARVLMNKRLLISLLCYSIRKFAIGAASVMIGASIFGISAVQAGEVVSSILKQKKQQFINLSL